MRRPFTGRPPGHVTGGPPCAFAPGPVDWTTVARVALGVSVGGTLVGIAVELVRLARGLAPPRRDVTTAAPHHP